MKLSDIQGDTAPREDEKLPYPCSTHADPPITTAEARAADTAVCRWHNGRIAHSPTAADTYGRVFFCPVGRLYWRYTKLDADFYAPLNYGASGVI